MARLPKIKQPAKVLRFCSFLFVILFYQTFVSAQDDLKIGQWRSHLPYQRAHYLAQSPTTIYAITERSLFSIDKASDEVSFP